MSERKCRSCKATLGIDDNKCQACGTYNPIIVPWTTKLIGFAIVLVLVILLVDFGDLAAFFDQFFGFGQG